MRFAIEKIDAVGRRHLITPTSRKTTSLEWFAGYRATLRTLALRESTLCPATVRYEVLAGTIGKTTGRDGALVG